MSPKDITTQNFKKEAIAFCDAFARSGSTCAGVSMIILDPKPFEKVEMAKQMIGETKVSNTADTADTNILLKTGMENIFTGLNRIKSSLTQVQPLTIIVEKVLSFLTKGKSLQNKFETIFK
jgi:hypothetical protein